MSGNIYKNGQGYVESIWYSPELNEIRILKSSRPISYYPVTCKLKQEEGFEYIGDI